MIPFLAWSLKRVTRTRRLLSAFLPILAADRDRMSSDMVLIKKGARKVTLAVDDERQNGIKLVFLTGSSIHTDIQSGKMPSHIVCVQQTMTCLMVYLLTLFDFFFIHFLDIQFSRSLTSYFHVTDIQKDTQKGIFTQTHRYIVVDPLCLIYDVVAHRSSGE